MARSNPDSNVKVASKWYGRVYRHPEFSKTPFQQWRRHTTRYRINRLVREAHKLNWFLGIIILLLVDMALICFEMQTKYSLTIVSFNSSARSVPTCHLLRTCLCCKSSNVNGRLSYLRHLNVKWMGKCITVFEPVFESTLLRYLCGRRRALKHSMAPLAQTRCAHRCVSSKGIWLNRA